MRILIIGGQGTIGQPVTEHFQNEHEVVVAGRSSGEIKIDIADTNSIEKGLETLKKLDAIVCIAGEAKWANFNELTEEDYYIGLRSKLMGQVNLVRIGKNYLTSGGSITLSTGILADDPVTKTTSAAMENGIRVNAVSLGMVEDAYDKYKDYFPGHNPVPMKKAVNAFVRSVNGKGNGEIIRVYEK